MIRTQLNFDQATYTQLVSVARSKKISLSEAVRRMVSEQIKQEASMKKTNPLLGIIEIGARSKVKLPKDLASNHDGYLYGKKK